ncbi:MAG TPA: helix-turn-helix domain-containing protein, partial [Flavisolibacter sp.]
LVGCSMADMIDGSYDAIDLFGDEMRIINEKLPEAKSFDEIKNIIETFLLQKAKTVRDLLPFDLAMLQLVKHHGNISMEQLATLSCLSLRQFERVSKERIGIPPKLFARLTRFSKAYRLREKSQDMSWTEIAYECGYFDQMHLIRDFKQFAGVTPRIIEKELEALPVRMQASLRL